MISDIEIDHYRCFSRFEMQGLSRINLLVGTNNSGKTSALEAIYLLATNSDPQALFKILSGRGEQRFPEQVPGRAIQPEFELSHLFCGHLINIGTTLSISARNSIPRSTRLSIVEARPEDNHPQLFLMTANEVPDSVTARLALSVENDFGKIFSVPLTARGGIRQDAIQLLTNIQANQPRPIQQSQLLNVQYVTNASLTAQELSVAWGGIVLTPDEDRVIQALKSLDSNIERIASNTAPYFFGQRGGFVIKMKNVDQPVPIGSLGDGVWRMLSLAIALIRSRNGILLIDEIDTGLHYSVMSSMWKMIADASRAFNIQVFATSHSSDCFKALASINEDDISIHRIEPLKGKSVQYTAEEIRVAAAQDIEVR